MDTSKQPVSAPSRQAVTRRLLGRALRYRGVIVAALLSSLIAGLTQAFPILLPKLFIDHVLSENGPTEDLGFFDQWIVEQSGRLADALGQGAADGRLQVAWLVAGLIIVTVTLGAIARFFNEYLSKYLATRIIHDLRNDLLARIVRLPMGQFIGTRLGEVVSRFSNDVQTTYLTISLFASQILFQPFLLLGAVLVAFSLSWQLALCALVSFPIVFLPMLLLGKLVNKRSQRTLASLGEATESLNQVLSGMRVVRAYRMEEAELERYRHVNGGWARRQIRLVRTKSTGKAIMDAIYGLVLAAVLVGGSYLVVGNHWGVQGSTLLSFIVALSSMYRPVRRLSSAYNQWQTSLAAAARVFELLDNDVEDDEDRDAREIGPISEGIHFDHVGFAYEGSDGPVLRDLSFKIPAGSTVALVGPSGSGKSTVADLIFRFYEPTTGRITVDGVPLSDASRSSLLAQVAVVSQDSFLFNTTVRANIAYGRPGASLDEIERAAGAAHIHEDIMALPEGYETIVGERGARLSGGQLQRITIARAVLKGASFLLLDEATSNLDTRAERKVQAALDNLLKQRTALVIAHRLSTILNADRILVMEAGRIVEEGTHAELMERRGAYRRLYEAQAG
ncbi:MAG: ABC transporter ATP-binding protein [Planctomycetota bacterium]|nr:ABC transporter ATP-binding protein [Planctomycetota bacterium]